MDRREADELCARLAAEHPDREAYRWIARADGDGGWSVVKIGLPPVKDQQLQAEHSGDEGPPTAVDSRQSSRIVPPFGA
jgi:hypothetical protein